MNVIEVLRHPVVQAPIGNAATVALAAAVTDAGGMGSLAMTWTRPELAAAQVRSLREMTDGIFAANFVLTFPPIALQAVLAAGAPVVTFSWGISRDCITMVRDAGASVGVQVGTSQGALRAVECGADFLICQGVEAGGHVQSTVKLANLLPQVVDVAGSVPVIAAGGLADGRDVAWAIANGAAAAMLGTRFVATQESAAHPAYKQAIVEASAYDTSFTWCFDGGWPYAGHRVLRNGTLEAWEAAGCPAPGSRPGEGDVLSSTRPGRAVRRYEIASPLQKDDGRVLELALYAGMGCEKIQSVLPVSKVVAAIAGEVAGMREYESPISRLKSG